MKTFDIIAFGHKSCEHDISVITACLMQGHNLKQIYFDRQGDIYLIKGKMSPQDFLTNATRRRRCIILPNDNVLYAKYGRFLHPLFRIGSALLCFHGGYGECGDVQSLLKLSNIAYSGCEPLQCAICMDKDFTKKTLASCGFDVLPYRTLCCNQYDIGELVSAYPVIVKPSRQGSSIGISIARNSTQLHQAIDLAFCYDHKVLIEDYLEDAEEINCACIISNNEYTVSSVESPIKDNGMYTYEQKYLNKQLPSDNCQLGEQICEQIKSITLNVCKALELSGVVRIDYLYNNEKVYINEINTIPGSLAYHLFAKQMSKGQFISHLLDDAMARKRQCDKTIKTFTSSVLQRKCFPCKK